jgi:anti-sigma factor RsiW
MDIEEMTRLLGPWAAASKRVECAPSDTCLTAAEISDYVDDALPAGERKRAANHLSQCSFCASEVGALLEATRDFEEHLEVSGVRGGLAGRLSARLRVFVNEARGAFTRADALLQELAAPVRLNPVTTPAGLAWMAARGEDDEDETGTADTEALHEVTLSADWLPSVELLCGAEDGGSVVVSLDAPWDVSLIAPDGSTHPLEVERGDDRYYAMITGIPPGDYVLAIMQPEADPPNPLAA